MREVAELIARIEALEGASREVDGELALLAGLPQERFGAAFSTTKVDGPEHHLDKATWSGGGLMFCARHYTASLDAAVALVGRCLPGWSWECRASGTGDRGQATVWNPSRAPGNNQEKRAYNCASPSIALILALLRALGGSDG